MNVIPSPLVSCIMPTYNRRAFVSHAIRYFLRQEYDNKELLIVDDGQNSIVDLVPDFNNIRYIRLDKKITLGAKLNLACSLAKGEIIANWDDDDWYAPWRLRYQVEALHQFDVQLCGINRLLYFMPAKQKGYIYDYPPEGKAWLGGSSQCYYKTCWEGNQFDDINVGMDALFTWGVPPEKIKVLDDNRFSVHIIHDKNVSVKKINTNRWKTYDVSNLQEIIGHDWDFYKSGCPQNYNFVSHTQVVEKQSSISAIQKLSDSKFRNIYACLVHEEEDCVIDLVRNLRYFDPDSVILLYNGGKIKNLLNNEVLFESYKAVVVPNPKEQSYGYLHGFALDCMSFALNNFDFDILTIVDSDQLCIRHGYVNFLANFFIDNPNVGLLSSMPRRIFADETEFYGAHLAHKEFKLWEAFLNSFPNGQDQFVYWTFWPSTVFTHSAIIKIVHLFNENSLLKSIISKSKIWATEEVYFPITIRLLDFEIAQNPCSYEFVKFREEMGISDLESAMKIENAFWIHPVKRKIDHPLRISVRQVSNGYLPSISHGFQALKEPEILKEWQKIKSKMTKIEGWLSDKEAELLFETLLQVLQTFPNCNNLVEIGSYHGKASSVIGNVLKRFAPFTKLFAIDPHDGIIGSRDTGFQRVQPSWEIFNLNIEKLGLKKWIIPIRSYPIDVKWSQSISFLLIDGLHDYGNVSVDFHHFEQFLINGGYVVFHDYSKSFPGVMKFVNELITINKVEKIALIDSLMITRICLK